MKLYSREIRQPVDDCGARKRQNIGRGAYRATSSSRSHRGESASLTESR
jgi:hypothetical protein